MWENMSLSQPADKHCDQSAALTALAIFPFLQIKGWWEGLSIRLSRMFSLILGIPLSLTHFPLLTIINRISLNFPYDAFPRTWLMLHSTLSECYTEYRTLSCSFMFVLGLKCKKICFYKMCLCAVYKTNIYLNFVTVLLKRCTFKFTVFQEM